MWPAPALRLHEGPTESGVGEPWAHTNVPHKSTTVIQAKRVKRWVSCRQSGFTCASLVKRLHLTLQLDQQGLAVTKAEGALLEVVDHGLGQSEQPQVVGNRCALLADP